MSTLTVALACLGGVVLAGVVAHGAWQARKAGPKRADAPTQPPAEPVEPVLGGPVAIEPTFGAEGTVSGTEPAAGATDATTPLPPVLLDPDAPRPPRRGSARIDALIDAIVPLSVEAPVSGDVALAHLPPSRRAGGKPFLIEGLNAQSGDWEPPAPGQRYREFQAGLQLANRTGAINEIEFSEFVQKVQAFADAIGALPDFPDMLEAVASGRELDGFASQHDAQLAVHLRARASAWSVGYIQQHAGRQGFVAGLVHGRLVLPAADEGGPPVLTLTYDAQAALAEDPNRSSVRDVTLSFDVPQTDASLDPFIAWQTRAQALALGMDADLVDDDGRPLGPESFQAIGAELGRLYEQLAARELAAGSGAARRLFS